MKPIKFKDTSGDMVETLEWPDGTLFVSCHDSGRDMVRANLTPAMARRLARVLLKFADGASKPKRKGGK